MALPVLAPSGHASTVTNDRANHSGAQVTHQAHVLHHAVNHLTHASVRLALARGYGGRGRLRVAGISCVPYARSASGIIVAGNAWQWWDHATGTYARGRVPEPGSVLTFRANGRMRLGHVAVVTTVVNNREIEIDHANWAGGGVAHSVPVVDVSENNDWTAVRVGLGRSDSFGSIYPTYGFIYDRPDTGSMLTAITAPAPTPALNPPGHDLRPAAERTSVAADTLNAREYDEVAEAPRQGASTHEAVAHEAVAAEAAAPDALTPAATSHGAGRAMDRP